MDIDELKLIIDLIKDLGGTTERIVYYYMLYKFIKFILLTVAITGILYYIVTVIKSLILRNLEVDKLESQAEEIQMIMGKQRWEAGTTFSVKQMEKIKTLVRLASETTEGKLIIMEGDK